MRKYLLFFILFALIFIGNPTISSKDAQAVSAITSEDVASQVNIYRTGQFLTPLKLNAALSVAAQIKADDMAKRAYFSHLDPDGNHVWQIIQSQKYYYWTAGENLAVDFTNTQVMTAAWMNSPTHRANILNKDFMETGIGISQVKVGNWTHTYVVQLFASPYR